MSDFNVRSDSVNVEQIMEQIRARISEKRGVDYTEEQIRQLATVKLEKFLDPRGVRSDLLDQFRKAQPAYEPPELPNYSFEDQTLFDSTRAPLRFIRRLLLPVLKLFFNPNPLIRALHIQSRLNTVYAEREARREAAARSVDSLQYEVLHNLVVEMTRMGIEVKNLKMRVESLTSRLEFNERRARALESVVVYKAGEEKEPPRREQREREPREMRERDQPRERRPEAPPVAATPAAAVPVPGGAAEGPGQRSRRRRRRRGRRGGGSVAAIMGPGSEQQAALPDAAAAGSEPGEEPDTAGMGDVPAALPRENSGEARPCGLPVGESGQAEAGSQNTKIGSHDTAAESFDERSTRPHPFEQTFGAEAHPSERTASDPAAEAGTPPAPRPDTSDDPQ
jgi:hypothetical protein